MRIPAISAGVLVVALGLAAAIPPTAVSCTTVCLADRDRVVTAYNFDWYPSDGLVLINKRGTRKVSATRSQPASWTSTYGSVTFNQYGRDHPMTGLNERGLMVSQMWLDETEYPPPDARPMVGVLEWVQYHLDRHATVAEVVANAEAVRPTSQNRVTLHYLVSDASGDAATIEFLEGKLVVHHGAAALPVKTLTNSSYATSVLAFEKARSKGEVPATTSSLDRFTRASVLATTGHADPIARGFEILAAVAQPHFTRWSIVYDLRARVAHFRTDVNGTVRRLTLDDFDLSCATPVRMLDMNAAGGGDVGAAFVDYTTAANRALIEAAFTQTPFLQGAPATVKDALAKHPDATSSCAGRSS